MTAHHRSRSRRREHWVQSKWRPMMAWLYLAVCAMDFIGFPILWSILQAYAHGQVTSQWQPLTLQGAGLFHLAMGAIIGVSAYGRTREKIAGVFDDRTGPLNGNPETMYQPYNQNFTPYAGATMPANNTVDPVGPPTPYFPPR